MYLRGRGREEEAEEQRIEFFAFFFTFFWESFLRLDRSWLRSLGRW